MERWNNQAYKRLAAAVILQATKEAKCGDTNAAQWLISKEACSYYYPFLGLDEEKIRKWVQRFLKKP